MEPPLPSGDETRTRPRATLYVAPFLAIGLLNLVVLLRWGLDPLWAFAILPPILAITAIGWIAFRHGVGERPQ
ncbi:hypothetical protein [Natronorubrum halophilum]|uniref:hypothetical protein n=1 Tax=Natronorubrum halophilum TaxID=1702106 RepID=UPI0010C1CF22|nr:hypothetical protein [Natronorubrum halophilum]